VTEHQSRTAEEKLARIATVAHGVVTRREAVDAGLTLAEVRHRLRVGALLVEFPGVYRLGHRAPSIEATYPAAVRACGEGALRAGQAAAHLLVLVKGSAPSPEVVTPTQRCARGVTTRRARRGIDPRDAMTWRGIPVTTVACTLVDLASILGEDDLARACHEAGVRYRTSPSDVAMVLARRPRCPGAARLRRVLHGDVAHDAQQAGAWLPRSRHAWEQDRRRGRAARARGDDFRRYSYGDVFETPAFMLRELRGLLRPTRPA